MPEPSDRAASLLAMPARTAEQKRLLELQRRLREAEQAVAVALLAVARALDQSPHN